MTRTCTLKPGWHPLSIGLMVLGFVAFWPLGLAMLAYILWGDRMKAAWAEARPNVENAFKGAGFSGAPSYGRTGNAAFDDYRERELKRLEEERNRIEAMRVEFDEFLRNLRRAKDQEEFDRFMASRTHPAG
jgi:hypothetical protein